MVILILKGTLPPLIVTAALSFLFGASQSGCILQTSLVVLPYIFYVFPSLSFYGSQDIYQHYHSSVLKHRLCHLSLSSFHA